MASDILSILADRRDGRPHSQSDLRFVAEGAARGSIPDYQLAAWLMATYLNPLSTQETAWLTLAMAGTGERIDLAGLPKPWVDKHSTGGVGDKTSIVILPILAACGLTVIKMSGRGLGITGGTVDKLASIPGFKLDFSPEEMKAQAKKIGLALTGQSPMLAPADKALYALRDVTATVSSIPLIVSSILSKKIAGGAEIIMLDVKCGSGAFMKDLQEARALSGALVSTANLCRLKVKIAITDMTQPLGAAVGNALEVREALEVLNPMRREEMTAPSRRLLDLCIELAAHTLEAAGSASCYADAKRTVTEVLDSGVAMAKATEWFAAQGALEPIELPKAPVMHTVRSSQTGYVKGIECGAIGEEVVRLGGGRSRKDDVIDPSVGIVLHACVGSQVRAGEPLFTVHARSVEEAGLAEADVKSAFEFSRHTVAKVDPVLEIVA